MDVEAKHKDLPTLPAGCGYMGYDFGAGYIDSECFGGQLYDLDNCDEPGTLNEPHDYYPCPQCRHEEWLEGLLEQCEEEGWCAREDDGSRDCPYERDKMRFPNDFERCCNAWLKGWDERNSEK